MIVLLYRGTGLINALIRWQTRSHYAHTALFDEAKGELYESTPSHGVVRRELDEDDTHADWFEVNTPHFEPLARMWLAGVVGRKYDFLGVLRFLTRSKERRGKTFFCSELVYEAFLQGQAWLLNCDESWKVSPALLRLSPYLSKLTAYEKRDLISGVVVRPSRVEL